MSRYANKHDSNYLNSARGRRDHSLGRRGSEAGSTRGIYGHDSASRSAGNVRDSGEQVPTSEEAKWIHRDKLAKIESEELHQAALLFHRRTGEGRPGRGRTSGISSSSVNTPPTEHSEPWPSLEEEEQDDESNSQEPFDGNGTSTENPISDERQHWDLRRPEEIAADEMADDGASGIYNSNNPTLRKSSSRIPIPTTSPAPLMPEQQPSRSRATTAGEDDAVSIPKPRRASEPTATESDTASTPPGGSRPNSRGAQATVQSASSGKKQTAKGTTNSTTRKTSAPPATSRKATPKSRTTSGANSTQRPTTRSGESRPTTAVNRPEGDPPWLATMYKPDPRLPPDQQIIPTHARQMQQEQWEKEGQPATTYDREFAPLAVTPNPPRPENNNNNNHNNNNEKAEKPAEEPQEQSKLQVEGSTWPLSPSKSPEPPRPSTGTGYSPMPKVQEPPSANLTPKWSPPVVTADQEPPEEKKGGCGCCIVM